MSRWSLRTVAVAITVATVALVSHLTAQTPADSLADYPEYRIFGSAGCFCAGLVAIAADQPRPKVPVPGETTLVASPTSVVTMLTTAHPDGSATLDLLIVWRGKPNWFGVNGVDRRSEGGQFGTKTVFTHTYGTVTMHVEFDRRSRETTLDGHAVVLKDGANVILVDDVDAEKKRRVVEQLKIDASLGHWKNDPRVVLTKSEQLVKFLQCDTALADSASRPSFTKLCEQLRPR